MYSKFKKGKLHTKIGAVESKFKRLSKFLTAIIIKISRKIVASYKEKTKISESIPEEMFFSGS